MDLDIILPVWQVIIGVVLSGLGIEMANNPPNSNTSKWIYRFGFGALALVLICLTLWQAVRANKEQTLAKEAAHAAELKSERDISFVKGQLATIGDFVSHPPQSLDTQQLSLAIQSIASRPIPSQQADANAALRNDIQTLARDLRLFSQNEGRSELHPSLPTGYKQFRELFRGRFVDRLQNVHDRLAALGIRDKHFDADLMGGENRLWAPGDPEIIEKYLVALAALIPFRAATISVCSRSRWTV